MSAKNDTEVLIDSQEVFASRDAGQDRRAMILDYADLAFLEKGFHSTSMSEIAARIGGSKGTLYRYFSSKDELVLESVKRFCFSLQQHMSSLTTEGLSVRETLHSIGRRYIEIASAEDLVRKIRFILAETERNPELGRTLYEIGPARGIAIVAAYLEQARRDGVLAFEDPEQTAAHFLALCDNGTIKARWCGAKPAPSIEDIDAEIACAVRFFFAAYGT